MEVEKHSLVKIEYTNLKACSVVATVKAVNEKGEPTGYPANANVNWLFRDRKGEPSTALVATPLKGKSSSVLIEIYYPPAIAEVIPVATGEVVQGVENCASTVYGDTISVVEKDGVFTLVATGAATNTFTLTVPQKDQGKLVEAITKTTPPDSGLELEFEVAGDVVTVTVVENPQNVPEDVIKAKLEENLATLS